MVVKCEGNVDNSERGYCENAEINKDLSQGLNTKTSGSLLVLGVILNQQIIICGVSLNVAIYVFLLSIYWLFLLLLQSEWFTYTNATCNPSRKINSTNPCVYAAPHFTNERKISGQKWLCSN